jgi:recombination protein RecT
MADTVVIAQKHPLVVLRERLESRSAEIRAAWPDVPTERIMRAVITAAQINPDILACTFSSLWLAIMRACRDQLLPDGRDGVIVGFKEKATWIPMYQGLLRRFQQSGEFKWITANIVYEGEPFEHWIDEQGEHLKHVPDEIFDDRLIRKVYALAATQSGGIFLTVISKTEIDKIRKMSRTTREDAPWNMWFTEMAKKTALRRLSKLLPSAPPFEEEEEEIEETPAKPQPAVERERGAAAALDIFAGSPEVSSVPGDSPFALGETGGGDGTPDGNSTTSAAREASAPVVVTDDPIASGAGGRGSDPIAAAHLRGREAKEKGYQRKAMPTEYRDPNRDLEAQAWLAGFSGTAKP